MRLWWTACALLWLGTGCIVPRAMYDARVEEARVAAERVGAESARAHALEERLSVLAAALERLTVERVALRAQLRELEEGLAFSEEKRRGLEEQNAHLAARERQLEALHSELADVWFNSALSRAKRRSQRASPAAPVLGGAAPESGTP